MDNSQEANPYAPPTLSTEALSTFSFADLSERREKTFVYRELQLHWPVEATLRYSGWNFLQRVWINNQLVWRRISWMTFHRHILFKIPENLAPEGYEGQIEIDFAVGLRIRRMTVSIGGRLVYEEVNA